MDNCYSGTMLREETPLELTCLNCFHKSMIGILKKSSTVILP